MKKVIQIFEYDILKVHSIYNGVKFLPLHFNSLVQWNERQAQKYISSGYNSIAFKNFVGVIHVKGLIIEILPKADKIAIKDKSLWKAALLYMLSVVNNLTLYHSTPALLKTRNISLMDFFISIFIKETQEVIHKGLVRKYRQVDRNSSFIKGKILFNENLKKNLINKQNCFVRMTIYDYQNAHNEILKTAIAILRSTKLLEKSTTEKLLNLDMHFATIHSVSPKSILWQRLAFNRKNSHYKRALNIARLIIENCNPDIQAGKNDILAFLFDMNKLFERFVAKQCLYASKGSENVKVDIQNSKRFWQRQTIRPDLVFHFKQENVVADTKWKLVQTKPSSDDLKQMYVYNIYWQSYMSFLIYPAQAETENKPFADDFKATDLMKDFNHGVAILPINLFKHSKINTDIGKDIIQSIENMRS